MKTLKLRVDRYHCLCRRNPDSDRVTYVLYPMEILDGWIVAACARYGTSIVVITGIDWGNDLTPWPAKGVPKGSADFGGRAGDFLNELCGRIIPECEKAMGCATVTHRNLVGVSLSGLFTLWQWLRCNVFDSIACLSGSFWYEGFTDYVTSNPVPRKAGRAFFLLGEKEKNSAIKAFSTIAENTQTIVATLTAAGIETKFVMVPGGHYSDPVPRLDKAFKALCGEWKQVSVGPAATESLV